MSHSKKEEILKLTQKINKWNQAYFEDQSLLFDEHTRDQLKDQLQKLEEEYPEFQQQNSPNLTIGARLSNDFAKVKHKTAKKSLQDVFTVAQIQDFIARVEKVFPDQNNSYIIEPKLDGLNVTLWYEGGKFTKAITRGNGLIGEDISHTISTIKSIPQDLKLNVDLEVSGEVFIDKIDFQRINQNSEVQYANPRNLASGTVRQLDPAVAAERNLKMFFYALSKNNLKRVPESQTQVLKTLDYLGFPINPTHFNCSKLQDIAKVIE